MVVGRRPDSGGVQTGLAGLVDREKQHGSRGARRLVLIGRERGVRRERMERPMFWVIWAIAMAIFLVLPWTLGAYYWGRPWPSAYYRRVGGRPIESPGVREEEPTTIRRPTSGWGMIADLLWLVWLLLLLVAVYGLLAG
jgi:hypothetical protein